jgi:hypothetical protein
VNDHRGEALSQQNFSQEVPTYPIEGLLKVEFEKEALEVLLF